MRRRISGLIVLIVQVDADNRVLAWKVIVHIMNDRFADFDICMIATCGLYAMYVRAETLGACRYCAMALFQAACVRPSSPAYLPPKL